MTKPVINSSDTEEVCRTIAELLSAHGEWFYSEGQGRNASSMRRGEWNVEVAHGRLFFSCLTDAGRRLWRVVGWERSGETLRLKAVRGSGAVRATLEFIPRVEVATSVAAVAAARQAACKRLAAAASNSISGAQIEQCGLSPSQQRGQPGRYARILIRRNGRYLAVTGPAAEVQAYEAETFLAAALLWFTRLSERKRRANVDQLWLIASRTLALALLERLQLLRAALRDSVKVFETSDEGQSSLSLRELDADSLPHFNRRFSRPREAAASELIQRVVDLAPEAIDVVRARHGATLRFHGLAFARVRSVLNEEKLWFGLASGSQSLLDGQSWPQLLKLLEELRENRRAEAGDHRHWLYAAAPEAWLESLLRRDIARLDPGLIISPLHAQFRTSAQGAGSSSGARPVDLLALRQDGRLVIIELKVSEDMALPLQGAHYWQQVEQHRRGGDLAQVKLFGNKPVADEPPLVYLVAPMLRFARTFDTLAGMINPQIELYRFCINEDWREGVRVVRRMRVN